MLVHGPRRMSTLTGINSNTIRKRDHDGLLSRTVDENGVMQFSSTDILTNILFHYESRFLSKAVKINFKLIKNFAEENYEKIVNGNFFMVVWVDTDEVRYLEDVKLYMGSESIAVTPISKIMKSVVEKVNQS